MNKLTLHSDYIPKGDQTAAIRKIYTDFHKDKDHIVLMGVTGSGKTFTMANVISKLNKPVLVISHNKTLAAQLYQEFRSFFPGNAVEYFVSYYDYYQPEAYIPATNTYIAKEATINDEIDRMRLRASNSLFQRRDVIIVASVSCIYGIGSPDSYYSMSFTLKKDQTITRKALLKSIVEIQYERQEGELIRGKFRVRGDIIELFPTYDDEAYRIEINDDRITKISSIDPLVGSIRQEFNEILIFPRTFFSTPASVLEQTVSKIEKELKERIDFFVKQDKITEANRIEERTLYDLEMLREFGWCPGIENYSLYLSQRQPGEAPYTLLDYFPDDFLTIVDESHVTIPQISGMYHGDRARKLNLIEHGFRLPSALDNRPLNFQEFEQRVHKTLYVSATPGPYELKKAENKPVEQIIRPTGLIDPFVEIRSVKGQIDDLMDEIKKTAENKDRTLVTTLTKKMAENLTRHYHERGLKVRYLHSDIDTLDRIKILTDLRKGKFDALIGINLLREGLDLPEVALVAILDADKEGFLRSGTSLIQTFGRAARNIAGRVILYADTVTGSMKFALSETSRRRKIQQEYNLKHHISPQSIKKKINEVLNSVYEKDYLDISRIAEDNEIYLSPQKRSKMIESLEKQMRSAAQNLEFEKAARLRDQIKRLKQKELEIAGG
jgi:excinuclease ABC subunit B